jgi:hypothetical protein
VAESFDAHGAVVALNMVQGAMAAVTLMLYVVVRVPVMYNILVDQGMHVAIAVWNCIFHFQLVYFVFYIAVAWVGAIVNPLANSFLLLDIITKNQTSRDVLRSVTVPIKALRATAVLCVFTLYIYSFVVFQIYGSTAESDQTDGQCSSLIGCFKMVLAFGLRQGGGLGDAMADGNIEPGMTPGRMVLDLSFFIIVTIVLLNVVFGIIIDQVCEIVLSTLC